jgi:carboxypeptidase family protein
MAAAPRRRLLIHLLLLTALFAFPIAGYAQEATITGTVTDTTGAVLPGVTITIVNEASGITFEAVTDERGVFRTPARIGNYRVTAVLAGFGDVTRTGLPVAVGQTVNINMQMAPSGLQESVTVTGEAPLIDVTTSSLGTNISEAQMTELPINGRNWQDLAMLAVGNRVNDVSNNEVAAEGAGTYQINVDGQQVTYYGGGLGDIQARYSRDQIAEFEFVANRFDATQGRSQGVQINAVTRAGTNTPSGLFSGYFRDDSLNAEDHILNKKLPYSNQQFSTAYGGPLIRDRFHYFANYEFENEPQTAAFITPFERFNLEYSAARREHKPGLRLDYQFSPAVRATLRGNYWRNFQPVDSRFNTGHPSAITETLRKSEQYLFTLTNVLGNRAVNEVKTGYVYLNNKQDGLVKWSNHPSRDQVGTGGTPIITFNGGFRVGQGESSSPQEIREGKISLRDDFTVSYNLGGRHDVRTGGEYIKNSWWLMICRICGGQYDATGGNYLPTEAQLYQMFPVWDDPNTWNLDLINQFNPAALRRYQVGIGNMRFFVDRHVFGTWVQDDWQIGSNLTLNLGLRYDVALNAFGEIYEFQPWVAADRPNDTDNIQPRLGFAYKLGDRTVLRGGWGKYYGEVTDQSAHGTASWKDIIGADIVPDGRANFASNPFNGPFPTLAQITQQTCSVNGNRPGCIQRAVTNNLASPDSQFPFSWQGSFGFQRQLGEVMAFEADYTYYKSYFNITGQNINQAFQANGVPYNTNLVNRRPFPEWGTVSMRLNRIGADNMNHSIQMGFNRRLRDNWQASATYLVTWDYQKDWPPVLPKLSGVPQAQNCTQPVTWTADFSRWVCDVPVDFASYGVDIYDTDFYRTGHQVHRFVFNGIYQLPYSFQLSGLYFYGDNGRNTTTSGVDVFGTGGVVANRTRLDRTIIPRFNFNKKDLHRVDLRFSRRFQFTERISLEPMLEVFNLFDRANFTAWQLNETNRLFGTPTAAEGLGYSPRIIQIGFRSRF